MDVADAVTLVMLDGLDRPGTENEGHVTVQGKVQLFTAASCAAPGHPRVQVRTVGVMLMAMVGIEGRASANAQGPDRPLTRQPAGPKPAAEAAPESGAS